MKEKRLVWLSVNCSYSHSSLALPLLHSACREVSGWSWEAQETTVEDDPASVAADLAARDGCLVCATLYLFNRRAVLEILGRFHALSPAVPIAVGGPECLGEGAETLLAQYPFIRTVFRGEGEEEFPRFLNRFSTDEKRQIVPECGSGVFRDWASSPAPVRDRFFRTDKPFVQMETSRGCPMGCLYCTSCRTELRFRSLDAVEEELELLRERGVREIRLLDRTFNFPAERGAALLRLFRTRFPSIRFHLEIHPQFLTGELRRELSAALPGQLHIEAGIQTLNESVQCAIGRRCRTEDALSGLRFLCSSAVFETHADLLAGLPEQTLDMLYEDVSGLMAVGPAEIQLEVLKVLPGTPLRARSRELGLVFSPETPYDVMQTDWMSAGELLQARRISRLLDLTYNHPALHPVVRAAHRREPELIRKLLTVFLADGFSLKRLYDLKKRFLILMGFLTENGLEEALELLAVQWIASGYPAGEGPGDRAERCPAVPGTAVLLEGDSRSAGERETKFLRVCGERMVHYFAFNRKYSANRPAAMWIVRSDATVSTPDGCGPLSESPR